MKTPAFEIVKVRAGWFVFRIASGEVWASGIWDRDCAKELLALLGRCLAGEEGRIVVKGEPDFWCLTIRGGENPMLELHHSDGEMLRLKEFALFSFACEVSDAFDRIDREAYERNWMPFPESEFRELKHALGDYT